MVDPSPLVTVIVPALNEEDTIAQVIQRLLALQPTPEVIVVNDGSTDGTLAALEPYRDQIKLVSHSQRQGKGMAIRTALKHATGKVSIVQDADLEYLPEEIPALIQPILERKTRVAYGTRFKNGMHPGMAWPNKLVNVLLAWATRLLYGQRITDEATCYKAVDTEMLRDMDLQCTGFEFCPEVTAKVSRMGEKIVELPIGYVPRSTHEGKKIQWTDAPIAFWTLAKYRFWKPSRRD